MNKETRTSNSIRNIFFALSNQLVILVLNFISRTIFIKALGAEYLGINGLFSNIVTVLSLVDLGMGSAMVYSFYEPIAKDDKDKISALICFYRKVYNIIAMAVLVIGLCLIPVLNLIVKTEQKVPMLNLYYILFLLNTVVSYLFIYKSSIITADQKQYVVNIYSAVCTTVRTVIQIVILFTTGSYMFYLIINFVFTFLNNILVAIKADKLYPFINKKNDLDKSEKLSIFTNIKSMFLYKICGVLLNGTDNILISVLIGTIWVGYYSNYYMLITAASNFITAMFTAMYASIGNMVEKSQDEKKLHVFNVILMMGCWIAVISTSCFSVLIDNVVELWVGKEYIFDKNVVFAIILNFYLFCILNPIWSFRDATGLFKKTKYIMLCTAIINIVLSLILGKILGLFGILISTAIARLLTYFWYEPVVLYRDFLGRSSGEYFLKQILFIFLTIVSIVLCFKCTSFLTDVTLLNLIIKTIICLVVSNICFIVANFKTKEFSDIYIKVTNMIKSHF